MLCGGKDPPGGLELVDFPHSLQPRRVQEVPFTAGSGKLGFGNFDVPIQWICKQIHPGKAFSTLHG